MMGWQVRVLSGPQKKVRCKADFFVTRSKAKLYARTRKAERAPSHQTRSRAADTRKVFDEKLLLAEESLRQDSKPD